MQDKIISEPGKQKQICPSSTNFGLFFEKMQISLSIKSLNVIAFFFLLLKH